MADKISILGSIHSSKVPITTSNYPVNNIINNSVLEGWQYTQNNDILDYPIWAIIDLGSIKGVTEFKIYGISYIWGGGSCPGRFTISVATDGTSDSDFTFITSSILSTPSRGVAAATWTNSATVAITPRQVRYIKVQINSTYDNNSTTIGLAEFEVYGQNTLAVHSPITSNALIEHVDITTMTSDSYIINTTIIIDTVTLTSDAYIDPNLTYITSDAYIIYPGGQITSNASIVVVDNTTTITSAAHIQRTQSSFRNIYTAHPGTGPLSILEGEDYSYELVIRPIFVQSALESTSLEVIASDMYTSGIMDVNTCNTPLGYQNYDWSYDWVAKTYNTAQYIIEARSGGTTNSLLGSIFTEVPQGHLFPQGTILRYHQWRAHVWASGSGDFEMHQFTLRCHSIKPYVNRRSNLISKPFTTISDLTGTISIIPIGTDITLGTKENALLLVPYEGSYMGDLNSDGFVDDEDILILISHLFGGGSLTSLQAILARVAGPPFTGPELRPNIVDLTYLIDYVHNGGAVPIPPT